MPRKPKSRKICQPPTMMGFKPFGIPADVIDFVELFYEEFESLRLVNYEGKSQEEAADIMEVSRPTLTRIYNSALKKLAEALIEGKAIKIEGGNYKFQNDWHRCKNCYKLFDDIKKHKPCKGCTQYNEHELINL